MTDDIFSERRRALEESFFARKNEELLAGLREKYSTEKDREKLAALAGIHDEATLESLVAFGIQPETFAALSLVPLVMIAWSDDFVDPKERHQILKAAEADGVKPGDAAYELLQGWLEERPHARLFDDWRTYISALTRTMPADQVAQLRDHILGRAARVARAAGGLFGMQTVSAAEKALLDKMEAAFA